MKRRRKVLSECSIHFKVTEQERNDLQVYCFKNNISVSELIRKSINQQINKDIFIV